jgi:CRISPR/Cas system-associated exonuclease Cas4 (RecB family)
MYDPSIMEVGKRVHNAIDSYYKNYYNKEATEENVLATTYGILRNQWDTTLPPEFLKKAHTCVVNFAKWELNNLDGLATKPITECKIYSGDLMGIIDYLDLSRQRAVDFKTNSRSGISYDNKVQAVMYRKLVYEKFNINIKNFSFMFLFTGETMNVYLDDLKLLEIEKELIMNKDKILESWRTMSFPKEPRTPKGCGNCAYRFYCGGVDGSPC